MIYTDNLLFTAINEGYFLCEHIFVELVLLKMTANCQSLLLLIKDRIYEKGLFRFIYVIYEGIMWCNCTLVCPAWAFYVTCVYYVHADQYQNPYACVNMGR